jgi:endonuclease G
LLAVCVVGLAACGGPGDELDAGPRPDAGALDAGHDAGLSDAGQDAGLPDAGLADAGPDAGLPDAGRSDAGHGPLGDGADISVHTTLGLGDDARLNDLRHWLVVKPQYVVSFDTVTKTPNWVSWQYSLAWDGDAGRVGTWNPDPAIPAGLQAKDSNYTNSGYSRGHLCPSDDRTMTAVDNDATFEFTNAVPQLQPFNDGTWKQLETEAHQLTADAGTTLFLMAGPLREWVAYIDGGVLIPSALWKVLVVLDGPDLSAASVTTSTRVIAVIMPNDGGASGLWTKYRVSVDEIEARTGLDLLSDVDTAVQQVIEARVDDGGAL